MRDVEGNNLRVLLVEDAPFLRYAFGRLLRMYGFDVREATDGREALDCRPRLPAPSGPDGPDDAGHGRRRADPPLQADAATDRSPSWQSPPTPPNRPSGRPATPAPSTSSPSRSTCPALLDRLRLLDIFDEGAIAAQRPDRRQPMISGRVRGG